MGGPEGTLSGAGGNAFEASRAYLSTRMLPRISRVIRFLRAWSRVKQGLPGRQVIGRNRQLPVTVSVTGAELWAGMAELIDR